MRPVALPAHNSPVLLRKGRLELRRVLGSARGGSRRQGMGSQQTQEARKRGGPVAQKHMRSGFYGLVPQKGTLSNANGRQAETKKAGRDFQPRIEIGSHHHELTICRGPG